MPLFVGFLLIAALVIGANMLAAAGDERLNWLFDRFVQLLHLPLILIGIALILLTPGAVSTLQNQLGLPLENLATTGIILILTAVWGTAVGSRRVRQIFAHRVPLNADSPVHTLALVFSALLVSNTFITLSQGGLQELATTADAATIGSVVLQQVLFVLLSLFGVGLLVRRHGHAISERLGLERITFAHLRFGIRWIIILVIVQAILGAVWTLTSPEQSELLDGLNSELLGNFDTVWEWFVLALAAGLGEELLFRGALQPVFGLWATSILFAIAHVQYGFTLVTLAVFIIGAALGYIRRRTNTSVAIFVHFGYNFVLGLLSLLAVYLEQLVGV